MPKGFLLRQHQMPISLSTAMSLASSLDQAVRLNGILLFWGFFAGDLCVPLVPKCCLCREQNPFKCSRAAFISVEAAVQRSTFLILSLLISLLFPFSLRSNSTLPCPGLEVRYSFVWRSLVFVQKVSFLQSCSKPCVWQHVHCLSLNTLKLDHKRLN